MRDRGISSTSELARPVQSVAGQMSTRRLVVAGLALAAGCASPRAVATEPETGWSLVEELRLAGRTEVDLLFVVDGSPSMAEELEVVPDRVRSLVRALQDPEPRPDGYPRPRLEDLRVGVATATPEGEAGLLGWVDSLEPGCDGEERAIWDEAATLASLDPFDAPARRLVDATARVLESSGFARDDSLVAILLVSDGDDGSPGSAAELHDALVSPLRPGREDLVVLSAIVGLPLDGSWSPGDPLDDLARLDLEPSCASEHASASLPFRLARLVYAFENRGLLESICREDWSPALQAITRGSWPRTTGLCLPEQVPEPIEERCRLVLVRADGCPCGEAMDDAGLEADGRRRCELRHPDAWLVDPEADEWGCLEGTHILVPVWDDLPPLGTLRVECWWELP